MNALRIRNEMHNGKTIFGPPLRVTFYARIPAGGRLRVYPFAALAVRPPKAKAA